MVFVYGTLCFDRFHVVPFLPPKGGYAEISESLELVGGEAVNTALSLQSWGIEVRIGGNPLGSQILKDLMTGAGIDCQYLPVTNCQVPICDIYVTPDGQRTMFGIGFQQMEGLSEPEQLPLESGHWFTVDANHGKMAIRAAQLAKNAGCYVYLEDFVGLEPPPFEFWQSSTDWTGQQGGILANMKWLDNWISKHGGFCILSDGADGFVAGGTLQNGEAKNVRHYPPFPCPKTVDSTGAGDSFRAGMLFGLTQGWELPQCLQFASSAASLNCRKLGATTSIGSISEINALIHAHPEVSRNYE